MYRAGPKYLMWYDANPKTPLHTKIQEAAEAYERRFALRPQVVLVHTSQVAECHEVTVESTPFVRPNTFWVGLERLTRAVVASAPETVGSPESLPVLP